MTDTLFDESMLGPAGAPTDRRPRGSEPIVIELDDDGDVKKTPRGVKKLTKKEQEIADLEDELVAEVRKFGAMVTPVVPTMGTYAFKESDAAMRALVQIAKDSPKALETLHVVAKAAPGLTLGRFTAGLAVSAMVDFHRMDPGAVPARALGVTEVWVKTHPKEAEESGVYLPDPSPVAGGFPNL